MNGFRYFLTAEVMLCRNKNEGEFDCILCDEIMTTVRLVMGAYTVTD